MLEEIKIPQLGESVTEATIGNILKPSGSQVQENDELIELETEKVNQVLYAPFSGVVTWTVKQGDAVGIGQSIGSINSTGQQMDLAPAPPPIKKDAPPPAPPKESVPPPPPQQIAPVKRVVEEGRESRRPMTKIRKTIATRLVNSLHSAAMLTTFNEVDMSAIVLLRQTLKESFAQKHGVKLGIMSFFIKAVVEGLKAFPDLNSYIDNDEIVTRKYYDIGIAVESDRGLVVPVLRGCDLLSFSEIEKEKALYATKARSGKLTIPDLEGGGFTITNGGIYGSMLSTPILNPPQVGILGAHKVTNRAVVVDNAIVIRPMMYLALSYDHRIVDGKSAVSFLVLIKDLLEAPSRLGPIT